ncbi:hypothetical protein Salat_1278400 [Sesamum alatum]|uniref:Uncharacterized protein n=1 Tax=Sesamum alatum TaxID=300844 RepID=A0AAE1YHN9_9LAMI|nr:hypothetical protein Salat_1278400 [Sesamum alatum]
MQMYPGGGYGQHYYGEVEDYYAADDYHYNNGFSQQSTQMKHNHHALDYYKDDYSYKSGAAVQMKKPDQWTPGPQKHNYNQMHGYGGYDQNVDSFKHGDQWKHSPAKHNYNQMHGYGGYDHSTDSFKCGPEDFNTQYSEEWYEEENHYDAWNSGNGYAGHGNHYTVEKGGGCGAHQGPHMPMRQHRPPFYSEPIKAPPVWTAKSIRD